MVQRGAFGCRKESKGADRFIEVLIGAAICREEHKGAKGWGKGNAHRKAVEL